MAYSTSDIMGLAIEENSQRFRRIEKKVIENFGSFNNLNVIEIGAGLGTYSALMAKKGAKVTLLDYSETALDRAKVFFKKNNLAGNFVVQDLFNLKKEFIGQFDISMSYGLAEHFQGRQRVLVNRIHLQTLKKGGVTFISVPHKNNLPYRIYKAVLEHTKYWTFGEEYPYDQKEMREICKKIGVSDYSFFGESIFNSINYTPLFFIRKVRNRHLTHCKERGSYFDTCFSYSLILCAKKH